MNLQRNLMIGIFSNELQNIRIFKISNQIKSYQVFMILRNIYSMNITSHLYNDSYAINFSSKATVFVFE